VPPEGAHSRCSRRGRRCGRRPIAARNTTNTRSGVKATRLAEPFADNRAWFLTKTASRLYTTAAFQKGDILVFGSESNGLPADLLAQVAGQSLRVPMRSQVRSLNLSATAALVMYEAVRQIEPEIT